MPGGYQGGQGYGSGPPPQFMPPPNMGAYVAAQGDEEGGYKSDIGFDDKTIRRGFIRKVKEVDKKWPVTWVT